MDVGRALTPDRAVPEGTLATIDAGRFTHSIRDECTRVFAEGREVPELDWLIIDILRASYNSAGRASDRKFAIITNGADGLPCRLLAGLAGRLEKDFINGGFSTSETKYTDGEQTLPRFVFATETSRVGFFQNSRETVDIRTAAARSARGVREAAQLLVNAYLAGQSQCPDGGLASIARLAKGQQVRGVAADHVPFVSDFLSQRYGPAPVVSSEPVIVTGSRAEAGLSVPEPAMAGLSGLSDRDLAEEIAEITPERAAALTAELSKRADEQPASPDRTQARRYLIARRFHADYLERALPGPELGELFEAIAHFAFAGPDLARAISTDDIVLIAQADRHLARSVAGRIWPAREVPYAYAAELGRSLLASMDITADAPPAQGAPRTGTPPSSVTDHPRQPSGVLGSLAIAIFFLAVLALLIKLGMS